MSESPNLLSIKTTSDRLGGTGRSRIYDMIRDGEIEAVKLGRRTLIVEESVVAMIERLPRIRL